MGTRKTQVLFPCRSTHYPDGYVEDMIASKPVFRGALNPDPVQNRESGESGTGKDTKKDENKEKVTNYDNKARAARRAARAVRSLAHCARFKYFVTLTLDNNKIDRYDPDIIIKKMSTWCDNKVRRNGLCYILVPEYHKDGAIHFHGFFNDALPVVDSGTISRPGEKRPKRPRSRAQRAQWIEEGGHVVYNLPSWSWGFTTAIELYGDYAQAINYVTKYLTKQVEDCGDKIGGRWYYHGGKFEKPEVKTDNYDYINFNDEFPDLAKTYHKYTVDEIGVRFMVRLYKPGEWDAEWIESQKRDTKEEERQWI